GLGAGGRAAPRGGERGGRGGGAGGAGCAAGGPPLAVGGQRRAPAAAPGRASVRPRRLLRPDLLPLLHARAGGHPGVPCGRQGRAGARGCPALRLRARVHHSSDAGRGGLRHHHQESIPRENSMGNASDWFDSGFLWSVQSSFPGLPGYKRDIYGLTLHQKLIFHVPYGQRVE
ncbi:unnamed protein product, partial [Heterosigma akashiwo]